MSGGKSSQSSSQTSSFLELHINMRIERLNPRSSTRLKLLQRVFFLFFFGRLTKHLSKTFDKMAFVTMAFFFKFPEKISVLHLVSRWLICTPVDFIPTLGS